jgi:hypothetical protein
MTPVMQVAYPVGKIREAEMDMDGPINLNLRYFSLTLEREELLKLILGK